MERVCNILSQRREQQHFFDWFEYILRNMIDVRPIFTDHHSTKVALYVTNGRILEPLIFPERFGGSYRLGSFQTILGSVCILVDNFDGGVNTMMIQDISP